MLTDVLAQGGAVRLVADDAYPGVLRTMIQQAHDRVWASIFLVELDPLLDVSLLVPMIYKELAGAVWRGADVRLLIGGSRDNYAIAEACAMALDVARSMGIPARGLGSAGTRGSHAKMVIADDGVLTGSHNWSPGAFGPQVQDSVLLRNEAITAVLCHFFLDQWVRSQRTVSAV